MDPSLVIGLDVGGKKVRSSRAVPAELGVVGPAVVALNGVC